jgi:hypothetical protein
MVMFGSRAFRLVMGRRDGLVISWGRLGCVLVDLALKNQGSDPDRLDYCEDECGNETCDECRKNCLSYHERLVTGERGAVARIVGGVMYRRHGCETHDVDKSQSQNERQCSHESPILRQGRGA